MILWLLAGLSQAQMEVCPGPYENGQLMADLDAIDDTLGTLELDGARDQMKQVHRMLLCLEEPVDPLGLGRFARQLSVAFFFDQDEDAMLRWSRLTRTVAPDLPWPADLDPSHPLRAAIEARPAPGTGTSPEPLGIPKKAVLYLNGAPVDDSAVAIETPGLGQLDDRGDWQTWWQDGSAFPSQATRSDGVSPTLPRKATPNPGNPVHAERAAEPLFGEPIEAPTDPPPELVVDDAAVADATAEREAGSYADPFEAARRRAIRRVVFESTSTNERGDTITKTVEVVTLAREDRSEGKPVTYQIWEYWLKDNSAWAPAAATEAGRADAAYLGDWVSDHPPPDHSRMALVWVPHAAAAAYCASFDKALPGPDAAFDDALDWEWRQSADGPVRVNPKGKAKPEDPATSREDTGFRCTDSN